MSAKHADTTEDVAYLARLLVDRPTGYIVACVRACEGMDDPAAEIKAMREVAKQAEAVLKFTVSWTPLTPGDVRELRNALDKLAKAKGGA